LNLQIVIYIFADSAVKIVASWENEVQI